MSQVLVQVLVLYMGSMMTVLYSPYPFIEDLMAYAEFSILGKTFGDKFRAPSLNHHQISYTFFELISKQY